MEERAGPGSSEVLVSVSQPSSALEHGTELSGSKARLCCNLADYECIHIALVSLQTRSKVTPMIRVFAHHDLEAEEMRGLG